MGQRSRLTTAGVCMLVAGCAALPFPDRLPVGNPPFGTAHPTVLYAADQRERWMILCQARSDTNGDGRIELDIGHHGEQFGDQPDLYLVIGGGPGVRIDALADRSADGRWLAIVRGGQLELVDSATGDLFPLSSADTDDDGHPAASHRAATFAGSRLLYIRAGTAQDALVVHELASHAEREIPVADRLWRIDSGDAIVRVYTVARGAPWPSSRSNLQGGACGRAAAASYSTFSEPGTPYTARWFDLDRRTELGADGALLALGREMMRTTPDGALLLGSEQISAPGCNPKILAALPLPPRVIVACGTGRRARVYLAGRGIKVDLGELGGDGEARDSEEIERPDAKVVCGMGRFCIDPMANRPIDIGSATVHYIWNTQVVLYSRGKSGREILDVVSGQRRWLDTDFHRLSAGPFLWDGKSQLIDLRTGTIALGVSDVLHLSDFGRVVVQGFGYPGPLQWMRPAPLQ